MSGLPPPPEPRDPGRSGWTAPSRSGPSPTGPPPVGPPPPAPGWGAPVAPGWGPTPPTGAPGTTGPYAPPGAYGPPSAVPPPGAYGPPGAYPPPGAYGPPPARGGVPAWVWALVALFAVTVLGMLAVIAITFLGESSSSRFEPVEGPAFTTSGGGDTYGDNPTFDRLWDRCEAGDGAACDDLYWDSPVGSRYEEFGDTCGDRYEGDEAPFSCESAIGSAPPLRHF